MRLVVVLFLLSADHSPRRGVSMERRGEVAAKQAAPSGSEATARGELLPKADLTRSGWAP